ncbi:MFS general substrate transporter [Rickenella mellea]|uniref:Autophagy-related protein n=1 Tax=Rickenella mellea TaxID=50990 RepID=A0A4Y7PRV8_9AGAM|nr:MFS general substrate transporter [Rickenella mellea]
MSEENEEIFAEEHDARRNRKHLNGWLSYAFASEVFVIVSLTLFLPICLEQFARDNGYLSPEHVEPCAHAKVNVEGIPEARCVVKILWSWIDSASFSLYVYSISVALQALTVISMGGIANHPPHRKRALLLFAALGSIAATLFLALPSSSSLWPISALLAICANVGFGASVVAMNAYLPSLAKGSADVVQALSEMRAADTSFNDRPRDDANGYNDRASEPLLPPSNPTEADSGSSGALRKNYETLVSREISRISSLGIALGYSSGIALLLLALVPVTKLKGSTFSLRLAIGLSGIWWAVFSVPAALWLPGSLVSRRRGASDVDGHEKWLLRREVWEAWKRLGQMLRLREMKKLRNTFLYLTAWFLLSDGFTTITSTAILFGKTTLNMSPSALILIGVITPSSGIIGSLLWPLLQRRLGYSNLKILVILVVMASMIPAYGCLGFLPLFGEQGKMRFGGLTTQGEMFGLAVYFGSVYGAFQGYARAFYAELIPPGEEARWYGLFSITDKSSSFLGPLIVGLIADMTGNIRYAFFFLVAMIWMAVPLLMSVDVEKGRSAASEYHYEEQDQ